MPSPLEHLYPHIIPSLARVAPERARELQRLIDELGVTFVFDDYLPKMVFKSNHANKSIKMSCLVAGLAWTGALLATLVTKQGRLVRCNSFLEGETWDGKNRG